MRILAGITLAALCGLAGGAAAQPADEPSPAAADSAPGGDDGYCDWVKGTAASESALLFAPQVFGSFGYVDQAVVDDVADSTSNDLRFTLGVRVGLTGIYQGALVRKRASADCRRHQARAQVQGATTARALEARAAVLSEALAEAERMLKTADADQKSRRQTAQEVLTTRVRVDELRGLAAETQQELEALPAAPGGKPFARALEVYYDAEADVERLDGRLRRARAWDLSVRFGYDKFLAADDESPYFALVSFGFNTGWFLQHSADKRAARGRRRLVEMEGEAEVDSTLERLKTTLAIDEVRERETAALVAELEDQLQSLGKLGGDATRRYRETVWFEWVKARAEHEYLAAHVATLREILGGQE